MVSILVPVYNSEKYLRQCLDSIVNQTYKDLQVVIVDDGSKDNSLSICREYADKYEFIEVYHQGNAGVASARNALLDKARGDYTIFIDSDDWIELDMIEGLLHYIAEYDLDIVICGSVSEYNDSATAVDTSYCSPLIDNREEAVKKFILHKELNGSLWNKLVKTSLFHNLRFAKDIWYGEDALMMWQVLQRVNRIGSMPTPYYHYRMNDASISHQTFGPQKMSGHQVWATIYADTCRDWPEYKRVARAAFAISDMWLLFYAALDKYPFDKNISHFQRHVRENIIDILRAQHIKVNKKVFALGMALSYRLGCSLIRKFI
ncbi:MAG: glycosyltransferase [Muribaculaceae bacterium]